jgi:hypothetical protein
MDLFFDREAVPNFTSLCKKFTGNALRSPFRSTVPLLSLIGHNPKQWNSLMTKIDAPADSPVHLEFCVASPIASGNPSQTDALVTASSGAWAIEAKWTEQRYESVSKRINRSEQDGLDPSEAVGGWLQHLRTFAQQPLQLKDFGAVVYQVLHRAASACAAASEFGGNPQLVYLHFSPTSRRGAATTADYIADLKRLHSLLGSPAALRFVVVDMPLTPTDAFRSIEGLDKRAPETAVAVSSALCRGPLFDFGEPELVRI